MSDQLNDARKVCTHAAWLEKKTGAICVRGKVRDENDPSKRSVVNNIR